MKAIRRALLSLDERYDSIKARGYVIDIRGNRPVLIKAGTWWAVRFDTLDDALTAVETGQVPE